LWERGGGDILDDLRGDDFAGTAPGREGVEDDDFVILDGGLEFSLAVCLSVIVHRRESLAGCVVGIPCEIVDTHIDS
jgi:hypothetical protein